MTAAAVVGAMFGIGIGWFLYDPLLSFLARGTQLYAYGIDEPFDLWKQFAGAFALGGMSVCGSAAVFGGPSKRIFALLLLFAGLFLIGGGAGFVYA